MHRDLRLVHTLYAWRNNERRAALYGRRCRIVASGKMGTVLVEFENGERVTTSHRAVRHYDPGAVPGDIRHDALARIPLFAGLDADDLDAIAQISREQTIPANEVLIHEGEPGKKFFVLLRGQAEVRRGGKRLHTLGHGDFFGEISLLSDRPTTASVAANARQRRGCS